ncbi:MAG: MDR family MFS transporter [Vulcanibacillus sp.]
MQKFKNLFINIDRNVWIRFIGETINGISFMMIMPFFALYLKDRVDSIFMVGIVMAVSPITAMVGSIFGGRLADRYGRKPMMFISNFGNGFVMVGFVFFDSFIAYIFLSALLGLFNSLFNPAASAMVADVTLEEKRTEAYGLLRMGHNIGAAIGPILGVSIIILSKTLIFIIASTTLFIYSIIIVIFIRETLPEKIPEKIVKGLNYQKEKKLTFLNIILKDKLLLIFVMTGVIISMGFSQTEGMLPIHFDNELPFLSDTQNPFPYLMTLNGLLVVLFQFPISKWASKRLMGKVMLYGAFLFGLGLLLLGWLPSLFNKLGAEYYQIMFVLLIVYAIYTLGEMLMSPVQMTFVANIAPEELRGTYMGVASLQWILGGITGPLLGGFLLGKELGSVLYTILGIGSIIAGLVFLSLDRLVEEKKVNDDYYKKNGIAR